jgi:hypothetical protein
MRSAHVITNQEQHNNVAGAVTHQRKNRVQPTSAIGNRDGIQQSRQAMMDASAQTKQLQAYAAQMNSIQEAPVQRVVAQREGEESRGSRALEMGVLGATIGAHAGVYGAAVGGALGAAYGYATGYSTYTNHQKGNYQSELATYQSWLERRPEGASAYNSGQIFSYNSGTAAIIHSMLSEGKVMYTYDIGNQLRVSGNHDAIKHAIVAHNKDVYAAGTVDVNDPTKNRLAEAISHAKWRDENQGNMVGLRDLDQVEMFGGYVREAEVALGGLGFAADILVSDLIQQYENTPLLKATAQLDVTEDSGHYSPSYDSGHKAVEAWKGAGYSKINWTPRWTRRKFMQSTVENVDE